MRILTEQELAVAVPIRIRRLKVFLAEGLKQNDAIDLADQLFDRDHSGDDRRICFECTNYDQKRRVCNALKEKPLMFQLQRCIKFEIKGKK